MINKIISFFLKKLKINWQYSRFLIKNITLFGLNFKKSFKQYKTKKIKLIKLKKKFLTLILIESIFDLTFLKKLCFLIVLKFFLLQ